MMRNALFIARSSDRSIGRKNSHKFPVHTYVHNTHVHTCRRMAKKPQQKIGLNEHVSVIFPRASIIEWLDLGSVHADVNVNN